MDAALERIDRAVLLRTSATRPHDDAGTESLAKLDEAVELAVARLPFGGQYAVECLGLRASARKRLAQAAFVFAARSPQDAHEHWRDPYDLLEQAWIDYDEAVRRLLV